MATKTGMVMTVEEVVVVDGEVEQKVVGGAAVEKNLRKIIAAIKLN